MDQVERGIDFQGNAYSLFQTAIVLEDKVRERTRTLETALRELEKTNRALTSAKQQTETAQTRLMEAVESISEGFVQFDSDDRLILCNTKFLEFWPGIDQVVRCGITFEELSRWTVAEGLVIDVDDHPDEWLRARLLLPSQPADPIVVRLRSGRWLQIRERQTRDGGTVGIYTDITEIKLGEQRRREQELAEKSMLLQSTLDNLAQGVSVFDRHGTAGGVERPLRRSPGAAGLAGAAGRVARRLHALPLGTRRLSAGTRTPRSPSDGSAAASRSGESEQPRQRHRPRGAARSDAGRRLRHHLYRHHRAQARGRAASGSEGEPGTARRRAHGRAHRAEPQAAPGNLRARRQSRRRCGWPRPRRRRRTSARRGSSPPPATICCSRSMRRGCSSPRSPSDPCPTRSGEFVGHIDGALGKRRSAARHAARHLQARRRRRHRREDRLLHRRPAGSAGRELRADRQGGRSRPRVSCPVPGWSAPTRRCWRASSQPGQQRHPLHAVRTACCSAVGAAATGCASRSGIPGSASARALHRRDLRRVPAAEQPGSLARTRASVSASPSSNGSRACSIIRSTSAPSSAEARSSPSRCRWGRRRIRCRAASFAAPRRTTRSPAPSPSSSRTRTACCEGMRELLQGWGCTVLAAADGRTATLEQARLGRTPDIIIADYHLDDGAHRHRRDRRRSATPAARTFRP